MRRMRYCGECRRKHPIEETFELSIRYNDSNGSTARYFNICRDCRAKLARSLNSSMWMYFTSEPPRAIDEH